MSAALADKLSLWGFEENYSVFDDGSLGFALELKPLDISFWDTEKINAFAIKTRQFLNSLPQNTDFQFMQRICGDNSKTIEEHVSLGTSDEKSFSSTLNEERKSVLDALDGEGLMPNQKIYLFVRRVFQAEVFQKPKLLRFSKKVVSISEARLSVELEEMARLKEDLISGLSAIDITAIKVEPHELLTEIYDLWNPLRELNFSWHEHDDVRNSLFFTDALISEKGFSLGGMHHRLLSLKILPDHTFSGMAQRLSELPFSSRLFLSVHSPNQQREIEALQLQRRLAFSMVQGKAHSIRDIDSETKLQDLETLIEEMVGQGEKVFHVSLNVLLRSTSEEDLDSQVSEVLLTLRELSGTEAMEESYASFDIFSKLSTPHARESERRKRIKTSNLADFLPLYGPWEGHEVPRALFRNRRGGLVKVDPFSTELTNGNQLVSGGSGAGKSFLVNSLLFQMLKENPKVFIVDIGGSYKKLSEILGGQYVSLGVGNGQALNPFDLASGQSTPDDQKVKFLTSLVEIMTKEDEAARLPKLERAELESAIIEVYRQKSEPKLSDLRSILLKNSEPKVQAIGKVLTPWCGETPYGKFVDQKTSISLEKNIVCFDLKGMESHPDLQAVSLFLITDLVWRTVQKDRITKKFLVFDECWKLLENESGAAFIGECFRTFRKYFASAIAISQTIDDFANSKIASAILPNSSMKWILMQKGADKNSLKEILQLNEAEMAAIESLFQEKGKFSEAFLIAGDKRTICVIESIPLEYWIFTTDPRDLGEIETMKLKNPQSSDLEIILALSKKYPNGVLRSAA